MIESGAMFATEAADVWVGTGSQGSVSVCHCELTVLP